ncbi:MAG: hypothetical protein AAF581_01125 [Planctomycetota bacterium]
MFETNALRLATFTALLATASCALLSTTGCTGLANKFILFPSHHPIAATAERVVIAGDDEVPPIETYHLHVGDADAEPTAFVLAFTGNAGRAEHIPLRVAHTLDAHTPGTTTLSRRNVTIVGMQYPGYGERPVGSADLSELGEFGIRAYDDLCKRAGDRPVYLYGLSLGTTLALHIAATAHDRPPAGLILDRPPELRGIIIGDNGWWNFWALSFPVWWGVPSSADSERNGKLVGSVPALFLLSDADEMVRPVHQQRVANAYAGPKQVVWASCSHTALIDATNAPNLLGGLRWLLGN